ncbi:MAG: GNAT family N-acetyltransferase [Actinomycetota bacterium]
MAGAVSEHGSDRLADYVAAIDRVFGGERGRAGSVAGRWPGVFAPGGARLFGIDDGSRLLSGLVARPLSWVDGDDSHAGHAIGFVFTVPEARGQGLSSAVLRHAAETVGGPLVLWTGIPDFYARLGWTCDDDGALFGMGRGRVGEGQVPVQPVERVDPAVLDAVRALAQPRRCLRRPADWLVRPFGADHMKVAVAGDAYVVFGTRDDGDAIVYELVGDPAVFPALWVTVAAGRGKVMVNAASGEPAHLWLEGQGVDFRPGPSACWLDWAPARRWALPWLDRI